MHFHHLNLAPTAFGPTGIHAQKHGCPILTFRTACTGMHFKVGIVRIRFTGKQHIDLSAVDFLLQLADCVFRVSNNRLVAFLFAHGDEFDTVIERLLQRVNAVDAVFQLLALTHQLLRFLCIIP